MVKWTTKVDEAGERVKVLDRDWSGASAFGFDRGEDSFYCVCDGEKYWFPKGLSNPIAYLSMHYQGSKDARKALLRNMLYGEDDEFLGEVGAFIDDIKREGNDEDSDDG